MKTRPLPVLAQPVKGRVCWSCEHIWCSAGSPGYSEMTPGFEFELSCGKGFWEFDNRGDCLDDFRAKLLSAERCGAFEMNRALGEA